MKKNLLILFLLLFALGIVFFTGCQQQQSVCGPHQEAIVTCVDIDQETDHPTLTFNLTTTTENIQAQASTTNEQSTTTQELIEEITTTTTPEMSSTTATSSSTTTTQTSLEQSYDAVKEYTEGDLISFRSLKVVDPDNDKVTITFSPPLNATGEWQTKEGDAGEYYVTITASDGKAEVSKVVKLIVKALNHPPLIEIPDTITVKEGDTVMLTPEVSDPDGDPLTITYAGWMNTSMYQTTYDDAGKHQVVIVASDGKVEVTRVITVIVEDVNRPPVIEEIAPILVTEGDLIQIQPKVFDPDGDKVTLIYESPLNASGAWQTKEGDAGKYSITITATDGKDYSSENVEITVMKRNHPPVILINDSITVNEGDTITLHPVITDEDNDEVTVTYEGWMKNNTYTTTYDDAGEHRVKIIADDGTDKTEKIVTIIVNDVNRPPEFII